MVVRARLRGDRRRACDTCPDRCRPDPDWESGEGGCPLARWPVIPPGGLGSLIETLVKPLAKSLRLGCIDEQGNLRPESGCAKRRDTLNKIFPA